MYTLLPNQLLHQCYKVKAKYHVIKCKKIMKSFLRYKEQGVVVWSVE